LSYKRARETWIGRLVAAGLLLTAGLTVPATVPSNGPTALPCLGQAEHEAAAVIEAVRCGRPVRITGLTTAKTEAVALPSGLVRMTVSAEVTRVRRGAGWVPLDLTLRPGPDGRIITGAHPGDLEVAGAGGTAAGERELASIRLGAGRLAMSWPGPLRAPVLDGPAATYPDALPGVDLVVRATATGFEQRLVVRSRDAAGQVAQVRLPLRGAGVASGSVGADGSVLLRDGAGNELVQVPPLLMWQATGPVEGGPTLARGVAAQVVPVAGGVDLVLRPDLGWLRDPSTRYPVVIDPVIGPIGSSFSTTVIEQETVDRSAQGDFWFGRMGGATPRTSRAFLHWPADALVGKQIVAASVHFFNFYSTTCAAKSWEIWPTGPASTATRWDNQPVWYDADPALPGNQPAATSTQTTGFDASCADGWIAIDGRRFFQYSADNSQNTAHMGIRATDETDLLGFKQMFSRNWTTNTTVRPYATVTYNGLPAVGSRGTTPETACVTGAGRPGIQSMNPTLRATVSDPEGTALSVRFEWRTVEGTAELGSATVAAVASGSTASVTVPGGSLPLAGAYRWRVVVSDGTGSTTAPWCEFNAYEFAPPAEGCAGTVEHDFDGDGVRDTVIADPQATVAGKPTAGAVYTVSGATGAVRALDQNLPEVPDVAEEGDGFGHAVAVYDANRDGCADLAVSAPYEDTTAGSGTLEGTGGVWILFGSPSGLARGPAAVPLAQGSGSVGDAPEVADYFGYSLAAGATAAGEPYLVIGVPGEDAGPLYEAGAVHYLRGSAGVILVQGTGGVPGTAEQEDRFGYAVAGSPSHIAVGVPGEGIGTAGWAGAVDVFTHEIVSGSLRFGAELYQGAPGVSRQATADDQFGRSVALAAYRPAGADPAGSLLAVGAPGEDTVVDAILREDAGVVHRFHLTGTGVTELPAITYESEDGDGLGEQVVLVNTDPTAESTAQNVWLAIGTPGEDRNTGTDAGVVRVFPAAASPLPESVLVERGGGRLPGSPTNGELLGLAVGGNRQYLLVASPFTARTVWAIPWSSLATGSAIPAHTWQAGQGGFPAGVTFGGALR
jgi:hypothetical protein